MVVGFSETAGTRIPHAFSWQAGSITDLGLTPGILANQQSQALGVNRSGQVVGTAIFPGEGGFRAALWQSGTVRNLGVLPGKTSSDALDINDAGTIVGNSSDEFSASRAFVWINGRLFDLNDLLENPPSPGIVLETATVISSDGTIGGTAGQRVFRLTRLR